MTSHAKRFLADLENAGEVVTDPDILSSYASDQAAPGLLHPGKPLAMVRPKSAPEVQAAVRAAALHRVPIVPRGAGSGLSGGANAVDGCLVICTEQMSELIEIDRGSMWARVQPGVVNARLASAATEQGMYYPPDPASYEFSTLGGNIATNAGGLCCVKYGVTRDVVLEVEVVLADGRLVRLGRRTRKGVAGYDIVSLICGSEGTLGIVTEACLRLLPAPAPAATLAASFTTLGAAGDAVGRIVRNSTPSVLELMDRRTIAAVERFAPQGLDESVEALLFARSDAGGSTALHDVERMAEWCEAAGAALTVTTDDAAEGRMLMNARRLAYPALEAMGATLLDDVCVPLASIPTLLEGAQAISDRLGVTIGTFGHAGDGNMHPTIVYDPNEQEEVSLAQIAFKELLALALELGGTITGEHGVGVLKRPYVMTELRSSYGLHRSIKDAFDPAGLLNPGKAI
jgi:glycolate oxidase